MNIKVKISRQENAKYFNVNIGDIIECDFEDVYLKAVVGSEIGNAHIEACKAQAIAARTYAWNAVKNKSVISDSSSYAQAFRTSRLTSSYKNAQLGVEQTKGIVICYNSKPITTCSFSANNGGRTVSSQDRWGGYRPYLLAKEDPWDAAGGSGKTGHGVGMSQRGAKYAASIGKTYEEILAFYYDGTELFKNYGEERIIKDVKKISAKILIDEFYKMLPWIYIWGGARTGVVDCSGAFTYVFKKYGSFMYHGSNTMIRKYSYPPFLIKGNEDKLKPGMAIYKRSFDGKEPVSYRKDGLGNVHHVGLYIGGGLAIEAKGAAYGVVMSRVKDWDYASELKSSDGTEILYDVPEFIPKEKTGIIISSGNLNIRDCTSSIGKVLKTIKNGTTVSVLDIKTDDGWIAIKTNNEIGFVMSKYIKTDDSEQIKNTVKMTVSVKKSPLNVRVGPGTKYASIGVLTNGTTVEVYEVKNTWAKIKHNDTEAYVSAKYLV